MNNNGDNNSTFPGAIGVAPQSGNPTAPQTFVPPVQPVPGTMNTQAPAVPSAFGMPPAPAPIAPNQTPPQSPVPGAAGWGSPQTQPVTPSWTPPVSAPPPGQPFTPPPPSSDFKPEHDEKSKLPLLIAGILLILAIAGGYFLYMLYQAPAIPVEQPAPIENAVQEAPTPTMTEEEEAQAEIDTLEDVSSSDDIEALQKDVNKTDFSTIDSGLTPAQ